MAGLRRRELLHATGAAALAFGGAGLLRGPPAAVAQPRATAARPPLPPMMKGISLIGEVNPYSDRLGVRPYLLRGPRPVDVVSLWIRWDQVQPWRPDPLTRAGSFASLADPDGPAGRRFAELDLQIAQANADGRKVVLTVYQAFPPWSHLSMAPPVPTLTGSAAIPQRGQGGLPDDARVPDGLGVDGPWAWFIAALCARYADTGGEPTPGPGIGGATVGNPRAATVDWLSPLNEPNLAWWPQRSPTYPDGTIVSVVAAMMETAAEVAAAYRGGAMPRGPALLMPNTADVVEETSVRGMPWRSFTTALLAALAGWEPPVPVGWSQHNYADVKYGPQRSGIGAGRWRAEETIALLEQGGWHEPALWLTEGGYQFGVEPASAAPNHFVVDPASTADRGSADVFAEQVARLEENWRAMARLPVRLWTQYLVNDLDVRFQSSVRGPVRPGPDGVPAGHEPPYPAYRTWPLLGAAP